VCRSRRARYPAFGLLLSPTIAAAAMALSSVSVIANSLRLRRSRALLEADAPLGRRIVWFELDRVAFEPRGTRLRPSSHEQLNAIAEILAAHPRAMATIAAYGSARKSSKRRGDALVEALTSLGVDASRLRSKALGSKPSLVTGSRNGSEPNGGLLLGVSSK
jgi:Cu+-exporting ATPase